MVKPGLKIVALDAHTMNPGDLSWDAFHELGNLDIYARSNPDEVIPRLKEAEILLVNKVKIGKNVLDQLPDLKLIVVTATGYDNVDVTCASEKGIPVYNAVGYSSSSVAQHVFALLLQIVSRVDLHNQSVHNGDWAAQSDFSYFKVPIQELSGMTMGLFGLGNIGLEVSEIGKAFGMRMIATKRSKTSGSMNGVELVSFDSLVRNSDILSLHAPMTSQTKALFDSKVFSIMKSNAILINTARGQIINEIDLFHALKNHEIAAAALDVLSKEPPSQNHLLFGLENCIITPHHAWASVAARKRLMGISYQNIASFLKGDTTNRVN